MDYKELAPIIEKVFKEGLGQTKNPRFGNSVNATMSLSNSIKVSTISNGLEAQFNEYGYYINDGTRGTKKRKKQGKRGKGPFKPQQGTMIFNIMQWMKARGLGNDLGRGFAIRESILKNGIKANDWIGNTINLMFDEDGEVVQYLLQLGTEEIEEEITNIIEAIEGI